MVNICNLQKNVFLFQTLHNVLFHFKIKEMVQHGVLGCSSSVRQRLSLVFAAICKRMRERLSVILALATKQAKQGRNC